LFYKITSEPQTYTYTQIVYIYVPRPRPETAVWLVMSFVARTGYPARFQNLLPVYSRFQSRVIDTSRDVAASETLAETLKLPRPHPW